MDDICLCGCPRSEHMASSRLISSGWCLGCTTYFPNLKNQRHNFKLDNLKYLEQLSRGK